MIKISEWRVRIACAALGTVTWLGAGSAVAQSLAVCGGRPVTVIIPSTAGGPLDREGRVYLNKLTTFTNQQYVMDFKPGAGTTIGTTFAARAPGDGCTLIAISGSFPVFPAFYSNLPFDITRDFAYVSQMSQRTTVLMVRNEFPARTFPEYLAYARNNPGKINLATAGAGGIQHLAGAWLHQASNTQVTFVHYKGASQAVLDVVAGRVDALPTTAISALPLVRAGKVRVLALGNNRLSKHLPELRPISEQGVPGYNYSAWMGFAAPSATPAPIVNRLSEGFAKVARSEDIIASQDAEGSVMIGNTSEEFREIVLTEMRIWQKLVKETGIKIEE